MIGWESLATDRLVLRRWRESDRADFHALNSDVDVMATIGPVMTRAESDAFMNRINAGFDAVGYGLWCLDLDGEAIGYTGFMKPWFRDGMEIGWRIRSEHWGHGFAPEAARACLAVGFAPRSRGGIGFEELLTFTAVTNVKSIRVMEKLGFHRDPDGDFDHPSLPIGNPLRAHVLYRMTLEQYRESA